MMHLQALYIIGKMSMLAKNPNIKITNHKQF